MPYLFFLDKGKKDKDKGFLENMLLNLFVFALSEIN